MRGSYKGRPRLILRLELNMAVELLGHGQPKQPSQMLLQTQHPVSKEGQSLSYKEDSVDGCEFLCCMLSVSESAISADPCLSPTHNMV